MGTPDVKTVSTVSLKSMLVPSKSTTCEYPGFPGFEVDIAFLARETLQKLRKQATTTKYKNRAPIEELDDDLFLELYVNATITGWRGLKLKYLAALSPVDLKNEDPEAEIAYTKENALELMKSSVNFDNFISEQSTDLTNFSTSKSKETESE